MNDLKPVNGRRSNGTFPAGNPGGPGNPYANRVGELRAALIDAITPADVSAVVAGLIESAKAGDVAAARELLDRVFGKAAQPIIASLQAEVKAAPADAEPFDYAAVEREIEKMTRDHAEKIYGPNPVIRDGR